ncbi:hypothetical protein ACOSQ3_024178 [Xanthoceras sorbifolium]
MGVLAFGSSLVFDLFKSKNFINIKIIAKFTQTHEVVHFPLKRQFLSSFEFTRFIYDFHLLSLQIKTTPNLFSQDLLLHSLRNIV